MASFSGGAGAVQTLAARWFPAGAEVTPLATAGFSGSPVFLVRPPGGRPHVLKAFASETGLERARWIHALADHLQFAGVHEVPAVLPPASGETVVATKDGRLWEMVAFVAGTPAADPEPVQIAAAMRTLARIHAATATLPASPPAQAASRGLVDRIARARALLATPWQNMLSQPPALASELASALEERLASAVALFAAGDGAQMLLALARIEPSPLLCQVVLRDVWSEHILFANPDRVVGVIDLHAAGIDTPATDLARLLGSWLPPHALVGPEWWAGGIAAYQTLRPLTAREVSLVPLLAASGVVFGLDNWFRWVLGEGRSFAAPARVVSRVDRLLATLPAALATL